MNKSTNKFMKTGEDATLAMMRVITIGLVVLLAILMLVFFFKISDSGYGYSYSYSEMARSLNSGDYPEVTDMALHNDAYGSTKKEDTEEFSSFARLYEAYMAYRAYLGAGDSENASKQLEIMNENYAEISDSDIKNAADLLMNGGQ